MKQKTLENKIESTIDSLQVTIDISTRKRLIKRLNDFNTKYQKKFGEFYHPYHGEINYFYKGI